MPAFWTMLQQQYRIAVYELHNEMKGERLIPMKKDSNGSEDATIIVLNEQGEEIECDVIFTFDSEETGKSYIVYTDNTMDENGNIKIYASCYDPHADGSELLPIETDREWEIIETILDNLQEEIGE